MAVIFTCLNNAANQFSSIVKKKLICRLAFLIPATLLALGGTLSCNKSTTTSDDIVVTASNVAIREFTLKADTRILDALDSVFFSIDLENGVIFNADSLPKGTKISALIPVMTFATTPTAVSIVMNEGKDDSKTVNYLTNSTDSIDFTKDVKVNVTAADGTNKFTYRIKVNVHEQYPDSMMWHELARVDLPSRLENPREQKAVVKGEMTSILIEESDGSYTLSTTESLAEAKWDKKEITLDFVPSPESFTATAGAYWILDTDGNLYTSTSGNDWDATGERWITLIGPYQNSVLGVKDTSGKLMHCHYPATETIGDTEMEETFPLYGRSELRAIDSKWTNEPTVLFVGGTMADGTVSAKTWAFDGNVWATIDAQPTPALDGCTLFKYIVYRETKQAFKQIAYEAWIVLGGILGNGNYNRKMYISFDNGVTWREGSSMLMLPDFIPDLAYANSVVEVSSLEANLTDNWKFDTRSGIQLPYEIVGYDISWKCPYIYLIGGELRGGGISDSIWRGVLARLTFTPLI